jgi:hypothetical protein
VRSPVPYRSSGAPSLPPLLQSRPTKPSSETGAPEAPCLTSHGRHCLGLLGPPRALTRDGSAIRPCGVFSAYASFLRTSRALHLGIPDPPAQMPVSQRRLRSKRMLDSLNLSALSRKAPEKDTHPLSGAGADQRSRHPDRPEQANRQPAAGWAAQESCGRGSLRRGAVSTDSEGRHA